MSNILIVDDNASARETLVAMLENQEYHIELAEDGFHALQILHQLQPDLILLDVMMPGMDGFEVCRRVRATPLLAELPILIQSGDQVIILDGISAPAGRPNPELAASLVEAYRRKYARHGYSPAPNQWDEGGLYVFTPRQCIAWTNFIEDPTKFTFED